MSGRETNRAKHAADQQGLGAKALTTTRLVVLTSLFPHWCGCVQRHSVYPWHILLAWPPSHVSNPPNSPCHHHRRCPLPQVTTRVMPHTSAASTPCPRTARPASPAQRTLGPLGALPAPPGAFPGVVAPRRRLRRRRLRRHRHLRRHRLCLATLQVMLQSALRTSLSAWSRASAPPRAAWSLDRCPASTPPPPRRP